MNRFEHYLKDNKTCKLPSRIIIFDTETFVKELKDGYFEHKLKLGWLAYIRTWNRWKNIKIDYFYFEKVDEFWDFVFSKLKKHCRLYLIAHNVDFDFRVLRGFEYLLKNKFKILKVLDNYNVVIYKFRRSDKTIQVLDSMNWFRGTLEELGKSVGIEKKEIDFNNCTKEELKEYCKRDVEILVKAFCDYVKFIKSNDLGTFAVSISSQALNAFRHKFMRHKIWIHNNKKAIELERKAFSGGRNECFFIGKMEGQNFYMLDVNSMYGFIMRQFEYPIRLKYYTEKGNLQMINYLINKYCIIAHVLLQTKENIFAKKMNEGTIYPIGRFDTYLTTEEIKYALEKKYIKKVYEVAIYEKAKIFEHYVNFFWQERKKYEREGNKSFAYLCKLYLNSLFGKFGQKNYVFKNIAKINKQAYEQFEEYDIDEKRFRTFRIIGNKVQEKIKEVEAFNSFVAIAAHITANARIYLYWLMKAAGAGNVYYCDTDSLIVNEEGKRRLERWIDENKLGYLKIEARGNRIEIRELKDYSFANINKIKGIKKHAKKIDENTYEQFKHLRLAESLRNNALNKVIWKKEIVNLRRIYKKGRVRADGWVETIKL